MMMGFWQIVMTKHALFERFSYYTMLFAVLAVPEGLKAFKTELLPYFKRKLLRESGTEGEEGSRIIERKAKKKTSSIVSITIAAILVLAFAYNMIGLIVPENGVHGVLPYQMRDGMKLPNIDGFFKG